MSINQQLNEKIKIQVVKLLYSQLIVGLVSETVVTATLIYALWHGNYNHYHLLIWLGLSLFFAGFLRYFLYFYFKYWVRNKLTYEKTNLWLALFTLGVIFSAMSWGWMGFSFVTKGSFHHQVLCIILLIGIVAAANPLYSGFRFIYTTFILIAFLPFTLLMTLQSNVLNIIGGFCLVYLVFMMILSRFYCRLLQNSLALQFKNEGLLQQLEFYTEDLEKVIGVIRSTLESTVDGIFVYNTQNKIENYNKKFVTMWNLSEHTMDDRNANAILDRIALQLDDSHFFAEIVNHLNHHPQESIQAELKLSDDHIYEFGSQPLYVQSKNYGQVLSFRDITTRKSLEEKLYHQANYDMLTGLPNRALFLERITKSIMMAKTKKNSQLAILFLDLDRFKVINDTLGHLVGDGLLKEVASRLTRAVSTEDIVSREGGDEFLVLLPRIHEEAMAHETANKILNEMLRPLFIFGHKLNVTISIGISFYPKNGKDAESLIKHADIAMYRAKELGRNNYQVFSNEMNEKVITRLMMENHLREALQLHELKLIYQPIVDLRSGKMVGVEELLRWEHFKFINTPISEVITVAEESGLISQISDWVFRQACRQLKEWEKQNVKHIEMSINLSPQQFSQPNLLENIYKLITEVQIDPHLISIEVTENVIMKNIDKAIDLLNSLRKLGMKIMIDDFGTGYSSLSYLRRLPVDMVKIDRSFIEGIPENQDDVSIAKTILALAKTLKVAVVAEGVETKAQVEFLIEHQCDFMQGHFFSKPIEAKKCLEMIREDKSLFEDFVIDEED